ncbi:MAG: SAF domain-containing protein [Acidimicrobiales bacterium]
MPRRTARDGGELTMAQRIIRRTSLPSSRSVLGGLLVTVAAVGVFAAYQQAGDPPTTRYVVATRVIDPGREISADALGLEAIELPLGQAARVFESVAELDGAVALAPLAPGDLVLRSAVLPADQAAGAGPSHEFSLSIDRDHALNGALRRGETVDVLATYGTGDGAYTLVAARDARVTAIDDGSGGTIGSPGRVVITLALHDPDEVLRLTHAAEVGAVTLVRASRADRTLPDQYRAPGAAAMGAGGSTR